MQDMIHSGIFSRSVVLKEEQESGSRTILQLCSAEGCSQVPGWTQAYCFSFPCSRRQKVENVQRNISYSFLMFPSSKKSSININSGSCWPLFILLWERDTGLRCRQMYKGLLGIVSLAPSFLEEFVDRIKLSIGQI